MGKKVPGTQIYVYMYMDKVCYKNIFQCCSEFEEKEITKRLNFATVYVDMCWKDFTWTDMNVWNKTTLNKCPNNNTEIK